MKNQFNPDTDANQQVVLTLKNNREKYAAVTVMINAVSDF